MRKKEKSGQVEGEGSVGETRQIARPGRRVPGSCGAIRGHALDTDARQALRVAGTAVSLGDHQGDPRIGEDVLGVLGQAADVDIERYRGIEHHDERHQRDEGAPSRNVPSAPTPSRSRPLSPGVGPHQAGHDGTAEALTGLPVVLLRNRRNRGKARKPVAWFPVMPCRAPSASLRDFGGVPNSVPPFGGWR